ncbi:glycoside hydrolase family 9 protein [Fibrobacter sp.]|uniref:glycoside hydrolase family 9 protein n=1 Tax=Fibrobacter sp. TaxID=35828 RepID=UPI00388FFF49
MKNAFLILPPLALAASSFAANTFFYNEAGYDSDKPISIVVQSTDNLEGTNWTLWFDPDGGSTGASVASGVFGAGEDPDKWAKSGKYYTITLDKKPTQSGNFHVEVATGSPSASGKFYIGDQALAKKTLAMVMDYFYNDRANNSTIMGWDQKVSVYGSSGVTRDVRGGWYDASGDVSKYLSHLSYANYLNPQQIPLTVWSLAFAAERIPTLLASTSTKATTTDEAAYGADFLVRMLDEQGFFYMTVFDNWGQGSRYLCAFSGSDGEKSAKYQTAFREGGGMAIAGLARVSKLGAKGDYTSEQYLAAAEKAYAHLSEKQGIGKSCAYCDDGKENIIDDYTALLAATELYVATEKVDYLKDARARAKNLINRLSNDGYFWSDDAKTRPFWHASDAGLPLVALVRYAEVESKITVTSPSELIDWYCVDMIGASCYNTNAMEALDAIQTHLSWLVGITNKVANPFGYARQTYKTQGSIKDGFFIPHDNESGYWWQGEDARLASLAAAAVYADRALNETVADSVQKFATDQFDWILGKNPYGVSMMYGIGKKNPAVYNGQSDFDATLKGGIANGITGKNEDGSGIAWTDDGVSAVGFDSMKESWQVWRWDEQWLPHTTWFMNALVARYDEKPVNVVPASVQPAKVTAGKKFSAEMYGKTLQVNASGNAKVRILQLDGKKIASGFLNAGHVSFDLSTAKSAVYMVKVEGQGSKKIVIK